MAELLTCQDVAEKMITIEASVVASIYAQPSLFHDNTLNRTMFKSEIWKCMFIIAEKIITMGGQSLDQVTVETMLDMESNNKLKDAYNKVGGYRKVELPMSIIDTSNMDLWVSELKGNLST